jgi:hypothetical protein
MTIRKLVTYGTSAPRPSDLIVFGSDREIARHYESRDGSQPCTVTDGSIAQSLGIRRQNSHGNTHFDQQMTKVDIDLLQIEYRTERLTDPILRTVVAGSLSIQHRTALSTFLILSNSGIFRGRDMLPRAHPNDGFVDVLAIDIDVNIRQRALAWHRSKTGSHLPHPQLRVSRAVEHQWSGRPSNMIADGVLIRDVAWLKCTVLADALSIYL